MTAGSQEGVRHAATENENIEPWQEILDRAHLAIDLGSADDGRERTVWLMEKTGKSIYFANHEDDPPPVACQALWNPDNRGVCSMGGTKRVVHISLTERCQGIREAGVVFGLAERDSAGFRADRPDQARAHRPRPARERRHSL